MYHLHLLPLPPCLGAYPVPYRYRCLVPVPPGPLPCQCDLCCFARAHRLLCGAVNFILVSPFGVGVEATIGAKSNQCIPCGFSLRLNQPDVVCAVQVQVLLLSVVQPRPRAICTSIAYRTAILSSSGGSFTCSRACNQPKPAAEFSKNQLKNGQAVGAGQSAEAQMAPLPARARR